MDDILSAIYLSHKIPMKHFSDVRKTGTTELLVMLKHSAESEVHDGHSSGKAGRKKPERERK